MPRRSPTRLDPELNIDRDSYEPAYVQLVNILRRQVASGIFRPGDKLPSESELRQRYDISPMTVRRAINILVSQGVVVAEQGRGTFVKPIELGAATFDLQNLQELLNGEATSVRMLEASIVSADERTARKLALDEGKRAIFIRRLLSRDGKPMIYHREYLLYDPRLPLIESELEVTSLRGLFDGVGATELKRGELTIEAATLDEEEAVHLGGMVGEAAVLLEHVFYGFDNRPVSWGWFIFRSENLSFRAFVGVRE